MSDTAHNGNGSNPTGLDVMESRIDRQTKYILLFTALSVYLLIALGGAVRVTGSGLGCPDWPTCFGQWSPPQGTPALLNYSHRILTFLSGVLLAASIWSSWRLRPPERLVRLPLGLAAAVFGMQSLLGAFLVWMKAPAWLSALHHAAALLTLGLIIVPLLYLFTLSFNPLQTAKLRFRSSFSHLARASVAAIFVVFVSGTVIAGMGDTGSCAGWPLCGGAWLPGDLAGWLYLGHRVVVAAAALLVVLTVLRAWRTQRSQRAILSTATIMGVLFFGQALVGAAMAVGPLSPDLVGLHVAGVGALWASGASLLTFTGLAARSDEQERLEAETPIDRRQRIKDLVMLTKPIIVALLLVTTFAGMVVGGKQLPDLQLTFWTMLAGLLAAGGSGAVNQYIDREPDQRMTRTAKRPIASGRMTPAEGLAFGFGMLVAAFFLMAVFVNLLAALLSLAGMLYYVVLYSIYLKHSTDQNIVIGGGAGAIPPLVGWAAVTGSLNLSAMFLFAIVFMWTPPHFWALALIRKNDYARAGIPMMPVVRGKKRTRSQIFIYTLELVALTVLMPLLNLAGSLFLVSAAALGAGLIYAAWQVLRVGGNKLAWRLYRYSSMYLALLFIALMVDALVYA